MVRIIHGGDGLVHTKSFGEPGALWNISRVFVHMLRKTMNILMEEI